MSMSMSISHINTLPPLSNSDYSTLTSTLNLNFDSFSRKVEENCHILSSIRNDLYDIKTFEEFKFNRNNLIQLLLDQENDMRQMNIYLKSFNMQKKDFEDTNEIFKKQMEKLEFKINSLQDELVDSKEINNEYLRQITYLTSEKNNKDEYIGELKDRLEMYERRLCEYQKVNSSIKNFNYNYHYERGRFSSSPNNRFNYNDVSFNSYHSGNSGNYHYDYSVIKSDKLIDKDEQKDNEKDNENENEKEKDQNNTYKPPCEKQDKASRIYNLVLKIFSSKNLTQHLKNKLGDDFHNKLTTKEVENDFIDRVEKEIAVFESSSNNLEENRDNNNIACDSGKIGKTEDTDIPSGSLILERSPHRKQFNQYTNPFPNYFDPSIQRGGRSSVISEPRYMHNTRSSASKTKLKQTYQGRLDFSPEEKVYNYREFPHGWTSTKEYFLSNPKQIIAKSLEKITNNTIVNNN